jgi:hypothetical protein
MKSKISIGIISILLVVLMCLANVPNVTAHVPGTVPGDPALDPTEIFWAAGMWSFFYGHSINYGSYIRDVRWTNPLNVNERYLGMLSVPYVSINNVIYRFASAQVMKIFLMPAPPGHVQVSFFYPNIVDANGDVHSVNIIFDIWDSPPTSPYGPGAGMDAKIEIFGNDNIAWFSNPAVVPNCQWDVPVRADFDIYDVISPGVDDIYLYTGAVPPWTMQNWELTQARAAIGGQDPVYGMEVLVKDSVWSPGGFPTLIPAATNGPWGGIVPYCSVPGAPAGAVQDMFHLLAYNPPPVLEYLGPPAPYNNGQAIGTIDNVVWDETRCIVANGLNGNTNIPVWLA